MNDFWWDDPYSYNSYNVYTPYPVIGGVASSYLNSFGNNSFVPRSLAEDGLLSNFFTTALLNDPLIFSEGTKNTKETTFTDLVSPSISINTSSNEESQNIQDNSYTRDTSYITNNIQDSALDNQSKNNNSKNYIMSTDKNIYNEGETIIVSFNNPDGIGSSVKIIGVEGEGVNSNDYSIENEGKIFFLPGENKFSIQIKNDGENEKDEIFKIKFYRTLAKSEQIGTTINVTIKGDLASSFDSTIHNKITQIIDSKSHTYPNDISSYKFFNLGEDRYVIEADNSYDEITGVSNITFAAATSRTDDDITLNVINDIKATFDQITGKEDHTGQMFRLYNAAFARFPDADGLEYWIDMFGSGANTKRQVANSFLGSEEFAERYGANVSDSLYVDTLYTNVLGRLPDAGGKGYWIGRLSSGAETRAEALLGFAESDENKALFSEMTGVF